MSLQKDMDDLRIAWQDLGYAIARETRLLKLANRLGMKPRPWILQAEQRRKTSNPAINPSIDGEEPCPDCGAPRKQGCGCWLDRPDHPWASAPAKEPDDRIPTTAEMIGLVPDMTGDRTTVEYVRWLRGDEDEDPAKSPDS